MTKNKDFFKQKAGGYDLDNHRVNNVNNIANSIMANINLKPDMALMDFGSGTGLLLERIAPRVSSITAVDISSSMNEQLRQKSSDIQCKLEVIECDLTASNLERQFDGIISSMTLHHIEDLNAIFTKLYNMLPENGFIALADLETEDGSFHIEDTGIFHFGFSNQELTDYALNAGFKQVTISPASTVQKPYGNYPVLLLTAIK